jgi:hypothetical protein
MVDFEIDNVTWKKSLLSLSSTLTVVAIKNILVLSEKMPVPLGTCATLLLQVIVVCESSKCVKAAFEKLKNKLYRIAQLLYNDKGLISVAKLKNKNELLNVQINRLQNVLHQANVELGKYTKVGFLKFQYYRLLQRNSSCIANHRFE